MQHDSVEKLFKEQVKRYSHKDQYKDSPLIKLILERLKNLPESSKKNNRKIEICEFGGGAGQLLGELRKSYPYYHYTNVEIVIDYKQFLVSKEITYIQASVLNSKFPDNSFDIIIMRDVLHHLIGRSFKETRENQTQALLELKRLVKKGGVIFVEELLNESDLASKIVYYLSRVNNKIGVHIPLFFISKNVIVAFLTSHKMLNMCYRVFGEEHVKKQEIQIKQKWYFKILHFFGESKKIILTIEK